MPTRDDALLDQMAKSAAGWARVYDDARYDLDAARRENADLRARSKAEADERDRIIAELRGIVADLERENERLRERPPEVAQEVAATQRAAYGVIRTFANQISAVVSGKAGYAMIVVLLAVIIVALETCVGVSHSDIGGLLGTLAP